MMDERERETRELPKPWCGDSSCRFGGRPAGPVMMTNGGCRCFSERSVVALPDNERRIAKLALAVPHLLSVIDRLRSERDAWERACQGLGEHICPRGRPCEMCSRVYTRLGQDLAQVEKAKDEKGEA